MSISYSRSEILAGSKIDLCIYLSIHLHLSLHLLCMYPDFLVWKFQYVYVCVCGGVLHDWHLLISCYISLQFPTGFGPSFGPLNAKCCCISGPVGGDLKKSWCPGYKSGHPIPISACLGVEPGISTFKKSPGDFSIQLSWETDCCSPWILKMSFSVQQMWSFYQQCWHTLVY